MRRLFILKSVCVLVQTGQDFPSYFLLRNLYSKISVAKVVGSNQIARIYRLIWVFAVCACGTVFVHAKPVR